MILSAQLLHLRHVPCFAHNLNLIVKKALDQTPVINEIRQKARKIVGLFRSSCKAKDKLVEMQSLMGRPSLKMIQKVETRWNSTFDMLQRLYEQREPVGAALANLNSDTATPDKYWVWDYLTVIDTSSTIQTSNNRDVRGTESVCFKAHTIVQDVAAQACTEKRICNAGINCTIR